MLSRHRLFKTNQVIYDQADFFQLDGFTRQTGLAPGPLTATVFFNNIPQPWTFQTGVGVTDAQVVSGKVYWSEVTGAPGFYSVRWRPNAGGYWRIEVVWAAGTQRVAVDYDVEAACSCSGGMNSSFIPPGC